MMQCAHYKLNYKKNKRNPVLMTNYLVICMVFEHTITNHVQMGRDFKQWHALAPKHFPLLFDASQQNRPTLS